MLCHQLGRKDPRVLAVAAPRAGDAAAVCAAELALAYAECQPAPILLLEVDTQQPRLASVLGIQLEHCFALQLWDKADGTPEPWRAVRVHQPNLHVMAVSPGVSAGDRLAPYVFHEALLDLSGQQYAHIIVVCPQVLDSADVALVAGVVDGAVLSIVAGTVSNRELQRAAESLAPTEVVSVALLEAS
jgi:Mrp family chromosome partitioning ATPase